jgi:RNA polymerase sigma-70 factor, ECF subfamily
MEGRGRGHSPATMMAVAHKRSPDAADAGAKQALDPRSLYDSHLAFVWRSLRRLGLPDSLVEDAAQDVFLVVHRRWDSFDANWSAVETWLFGIVLRVARNHRRRLQRRFAWIVPLPWSEAAVEAPSESDGPTELLERREAVALFERALDRLDEKKRAVFLLVDVEQLTVPQAAEALRVNVNTAYWRLREARLEFRKALARAGAAETRREGGKRP